MVSYLSSQGMASCGTRHSRSTWITKSRSTDQSVESHHHLVKRRRLVGIRSTSCRVDHQVVSTGQPGKVTTPLAKPSQEELQHEEVPLSAEDATMYRSIAIRAAYLAQDRPDLQTAMRSLAKGLQNPTSRHWNMLKRLARYVRDRTRVAQLFPNQSTCNPFNMWSDADHAGCIRTPKSVSGGVLKANKCCLTTYSKGQGVGCLP